MGLDVAAYRQLGSVFIIIRHEIDYVRPAMGGDTIDARTWVPTVTTAKCFRHTEFLRKADGQMLAKGITTWAFMDIATGRPKRISLKSAPPSAGTTQRRRGNELLTRRS